VDQGDATIKNREKRATTEHTEYTEGRQKQTEERREKSESGEDRRAPKCGNALAGDYPPDYVQWNDDDSIMRRTIYGKESAGSRAGGGD
jgi:hypothetical protein